MEMMVDVLSVVSSTAWFSAGVCMFCICNSVACIQPLVISRHVVSSLGRHVIPPPIFNTENFIKVGVVLRAHKAQLAFMGQCFFINLWLFFLGEWRLTCQLLIHLIFDSPYKRVLQGRGRDSVNATEDLLGIYKGWISSLHNWYHLKGMLRLPP